MTDASLGINHRVLRWARENSGYSLEDVARKLKRDVTSIERWESGAAVPTYPQLESLAYKVYKRPLALFFFPEPPEEQDPRESFRSLPDLEREQLSANSRHLLRQAQAMQIALREMNDDVNPSSQKIFRDIAIGEDASVVEATGRVREYLGIDLDEQRGWRSPDDALKRWRRVLEDRGVFVFKDSFGQKGISGFCLLDAEFPVIYLNNSTAKTHQIFSLFHELAHLLQGTGGIVKNDDAYVDSLEGAAKRIEVLCNRFSAEFLVPSSDFARFLPEDFHDDTVVLRIAHEYKVSREVVLRRALDKGCVERRFYQQKVGEWGKASQKTRSRGGGGGGDYYATKATYLGEGFLNLAYSRHYRGLCTQEQLADYLGVRVRNLAGLEPFALRHESA